MSSRRRRGALLRKAVPWRAAAAAAATLNTSDLPSESAAERAAPPDERLVAGAACADDGGGGGSGGGRERRRHRRVSGFEKRWNLNLRDTARLEDFDVHRTVGVGAFGRVHYVTARMHRRAYAMKAMRKEKIVRMGQVQRVLAEKRILQSVVHPFLVNLRFVFKTASYLYLVMPFARGGEIGSYVNACRSFSEQQTRFFSAQLVLALQYLHSMRIVYRDLKPENILLECDGYVKLADFGFAKRLDAQRPATSSFVGTPEYMAPEMLVRGRRVAGYGYGVDWWSLGVFIYECAAGAPPFGGASLLRLFDRIVKGQFHVPEQFSEPIADLLLRLFETDERARIGCRAAGAEEIKAHRWYRSVDWHALLEKKLPAVFVPKCDADDPASNFDTFEEEPMEQATKDQFPDLFRNF